MLPIYSIIEDRDGKMATQWYCDVMGKIIGPISGSKLLDKVKQGEVTRETLIRKNDSKWYPANQVNGLFEAAFGKQTEKAPY